MTDSIQAFPDPELERGRWCTYKQLMPAIQAAKRVNYNRQLPPHIAKRLDPQGVNTFHFLMLHEHIDGEPIEHPHVRAHAYIKLRGRKEAYELTLDIPVASWRRWSYRKRDGSLIPKGGLGDKAFKTEISAADYMKLVSGEHEGLTLEGTLETREDEPD